MEAFEPAGCAKIMNPKEALDILNNATSFVNGNRADHAKIMEAIRVIEAEISQKPQQNATG